jgi:hypothetical protein
MHPLSPDMPTLARLGFCILPGALAPEHLARFEEQIVEIGAAECAKLGIDPGAGEPLAVALRFDPDYRTFLFNKVKQLSCLGAMTRALMDGLDAAGFFERAGMRVPGVHQTLKADLPGDHAFDLPFHQDHVLNRSHRSCRLWVALRDVNEINGSLEFALSSHTRHFDYLAGHDGYLKVRDEDIVGTFDTQTLRVAAGTGVLFDPFVVHRTVPNRGTRIRFALIVHVDDLTALYAPQELADRHHAPKR